MEHIGKYIVALFSFTGVGIIVYSFSGVFTQKKSYRWLLTILIAMISLFIFYETNKDHVQYMKEDVLYIKPKPKT